MSKVVVSRHLGDRAMEALSSVEGVEVGRFMHSGVHPHGQLSHS